MRITEFASLDDFCTDGSVAGYWKDCEHPDLDVTEDHVIEYYPNKTTYQRNKESK